MLWKLAVGTIMLPAYLGISTVTASAAVTPQTTTQPLVAQSESLKNSAPQYYANNYYYQSHCKPSYRRQSYGGYHQQSYYHPQHSSYHQTSYHPYHTGHQNYHNSSYHGNGYCDHCNNGYGH